MGSASSGDPVGTTPFFHSVFKNGAFIPTLGGQYLIQVKENQPKLLEYCAIWGNNYHSLKQDYDLSHGLVCTREAHLHQLGLSAIDSRWGKSGLQTLIVMNRETFNKTKATREMTDEISYYLSNYQNEHKQYTVSHLAKAIRGHWVVESNNWQLDVTFGEDSVKTKEGS